MYKLKITPYRKCYKQRYKQKNETLKRENETLKQEKEKLVMFIKKIAFGKKLSELQDDLIELLPIICPENKGQNNRDFRDFLTNQ
jgi:hypothetical protein